MTSFAMVFPGQGSQNVGMLSALASRYGIIETTFNEASSVLGYNLWQMVQKGPAKELNKTWQTQPALLASSVAIWRVWNQQGGRLPKFLAGHSLGEYSALVCGGSLDFAVAISLVESRGKLMQEAIPIGRGAMSAIIGLNKNAIITACEYASQGQIVAPVNFNAPEQVVIAGHKEAVERTMFLCKKAGAKHTLLLPISVPSHCDLMKPAAEKLAQILEKITFFIPRIPVINSIDVCIQKDPMSIKTALIRQLYSPVRWTETVEYLAAHGVKLLLEIGPGNVLTSLNKNIINTLSSRAVNDLDSFAEAIKY